MALSRTKLANVADDVQANMLLPWSNTRGYVSVPSFVFYNNQIYKSLQASGVDENGAPINGGAVVPTNASFWEPVNLSILNDISYLQGKSTAIEGDISYLQGKSTAIEGDISYLQGKSTAIEGDISYLQGKSIVAYGAFDAISAPGRVLFRDNFNIIAVSRINSGIYIVQMAVKPPTGFVSISQGRAFSVSGQETASAKNIEIRCQKDREGIYTDTYFQVVVFSDPF